MRRDLVYHVTLGPKIYMRYHACGGCGASRRGETESTQALELYDPLGVIRRHYGVIRDTTRYMDWPCHAFLSRISFPAFIRKFEPGGLERCGNWGNSGNLGVWRGVETGNSGN